MVIPRARPATSSRVQPSRIRSPPLETPRTSRSTTRWPWRPVTWSVQVSEISGAEAALAWDGGVVDTDSSG